MIKVISFIDNAKYDLNKDSADYIQVRDKRCLEQCDIAYKHLVAKNRDELLYNHIGIYYQEFFNQVYLIVPKESLQLSLHKIENKSNSKIDIEEVVKNVNYLLYGVSVLVGTKIEEIKSFIAEMGGDCYAGRKLNMLILNQGKNLPNDANDCSTALTICGLKRIIQDGSNNSFQIVLKEFIESLLKGNSGIIEIIKLIVDNALKDDVETKKILKQFLILSLKDSEIEKLLKEFLDSKLKGDKTTSDIITNIILNKLGDNEYKNSIISAILSKQAGNLLEKRADGLYYGILAPPDFTSLYVDSVTGSDSNNGKKETPFKTIDKALSITGLDKDRDIYLKCGGSYYLTSTYKLSAKISIMAYGDTYIDGEKSLEAQEAIKTLSGGYYFPYETAGINRPIIYSVNIGGNSSNKRYISGGFNIKMPGALTIHGCKISVAGLKYEDLPKYIQDQDDSFHAVRKSQTDFRNWSPALTYGNGGLLHIQGCHIFAHSSEGDSTPLISDSSKDNGNTIFSINSYIEDIPSRILFDRPKGVSLNFVEQKSFEMGSYKAPQNLVSAHGSTAEKLASKSRRHWFRDFQITNEGYSLNPLCSWKFEV